MFIVQAGSSSMPPAKGLFVSSATGTHFPFKFVGFRSSTDSQALVVSPSRGLTPAWVWVSPNADVVANMQSGSYIGTLDFVLEDEPDKVCPNPDRPPIRLSIIPLPTPVVTSVVNAATLTPDFSPGTIITITGTDLSAAPPGKLRYDASGLYPTRLTDTVVYLNKIPIPLLYASREQIDAIIPHSFAANSTVELMLSNRSYGEPPVLNLTLQPTSPGIYTVNGNSGAFAIYNQDGTPNNEQHPAPPASEIQIRATGAGVWNENLPDASIALSAVFFPPYYKPAFPEILLRPKAPVSLTIGTLPVEIRSLGPVPHEIFGMLNIVALIPNGLAPGPQPIVLKIGDNDNAQQNVTVWVQ